MTATRTIPTQADPKLLDAAFAPFQTHLTTKLSWLSNAYGKCEVHKDDGKILPRVFAGGNEWITLHNDEHLDNHSFLHIRNATGLTWRNMVSVKYEGKVDVIFFWDYREVYGSPDNYTIENVKYEIIEAFKTFRNSALKLEPQMIYDYNVYRGFNVDDVIRPYGALRIECSMTYEPGMVC